MASSSSAHQLSFQAGRPIRDSIYIPIISIHDWSCHRASLIHLLCSMSITFALSQSMMQLFLFARSVIADLCSVTADSLLFPGKSSGCDVFNFLCSSSLVPYVLPVLLTYMTYMVTALTRDLVYTVCLFTVFHFVLWMH